jgi:hypothetical protein
MHKVDVRFRLIGDEIPADHGYHLFAAISRLVPSLHGDDEVGVHPISGRLAGNRRLALTDRSSLTIRLASDRVGEILPLAGKTLQVAEDRVRVGVPRAVVSGGGPVAARRTGHPRRALTGGPAATGHSQPGAPGRHPLPLPAANHPHPRQRNRRLRPAGRGLKRRRLHRSPRNGPRRAAQVWMWDIPACQD